MNASFNHRFTPMNTDIATKSGSSLHAFEEDDVRDVMIVRNLRPRPGKFGWSGCAWEDLVVANEGVFHFTPSPDKDRNACRAAGQGVAPVTHGWWGVTEPDLGRFGEDSWIINFSQPESENERAFDDEAGILRFIVGIKARDGVIAVSDSKLRNGYRLHMENFA